jgi:hypothetical protein
VAGAAGELEGRIQHEVVPAAVGERGEGAARPQVLVLQRRRWIAIARAGDPRGAVLDLESLRDVGKVSIIL